MGAHPQVSRIVVAFDGSTPSRAAMQVATDEAALRHVPLQLVTAIDVATSVPSSVTAYSDTAEKAAREAAATARAALGADRVGTTIAVGRPAAVVLRECRPGDLLFVGSHGHRAVARMLLGSTSTAVTAHATCPVVVVKRTRPGHRPDAPVVVGVDGSATSQDAVRLAADEADRYGVGLRAVFAVPPVVDAMGFVSGPDEPVLQEAQEVLGQALAGLREDHPDLLTQALVVQTHPVEALMRHAQGCRLAVVGSRGRGGIGSMLMGSVSREMVQRAPCPVAVVPVASVATGSGAGWVGLRQASRSAS